MVKAKLEVGGSRSYFSTDTIGTALLEKIKRPGARVFIQQSNGSYSEMPVSDFLSKYAGEKPAVPPAPPAPAPAPEPDAKSYVDFWVDVPVTVQLDLSVLDTLVTGSYFKEIPAGQHTLILKAGGYEDYRASHNWGTSERYPMQSISMRKKPEPPPEAPPEAPPERVYTILDALDWFRKISQASYAHDWPEVARLTARVWEELTREPTQEDLDKLEMKFKEEAPFLALALVGGTVVEAPVSAAGKAAAEGIAKMSVSEILSTGLKKPAELAKTIKALPKDQLGQVFAQLLKQAGGKKAIETIQRVVLDARAAPQILKYLKIAGGGAIGLFGLAHTLNFLGFLGEEAIQTKGIGVFSLVSNKLWKEAAAAIPSYKASVDAISTGIDALMGIPVLNVFLAQWWPLYKTSAYGQIKEYETVIAAGLEEEEKETTLSVTTNVDPALASIADVFLEKITPFTAGIAAGVYDMVAEKEGFKPRTTHVIVKEKQDNPVTVVLEELPEELTPRAGRLQATIFDAKTGAPIKGTLFVNDRAEEYHLHSHVLDLKEDAYSIKVQEPGYKIYEDTVSVKEGETTRVTIELEKFVAPPEELPPEEVPPEEAPPAVETTGRLELSSSPVCEIWIAGEMKSGKTPVILTLTQGMYDVTFKAEGFVQETKTAIVRAKELSRVTATLQAEEEPPAKRRLWRLDVNSNPTGAKILVNGSFTKKYTPDYVLLEPGAYSIGLTKSGYKKWEETILLEEI